MIPPRLFRWKKIVVPLLGTSHWNQPRTMLLTVFEGIHDSHLLSKFHISKSNSFWGKGCNRRTDRQTVKNQVKCCHATLRIYELLESQIADFFPCIYIIDSMFDISEYSKFTGNRTFWTTITLVVKLGILFQCYFISFTHAKYRTLSSSRS